MVGELTVRNYPDTLGAVIRSARENMGMTVETLAEKVGVSTRYIYRIESGLKKPSYDLLCKLIRELSVSADLIFFPDKPNDDSEIVKLFRTLCECDERSIEVVKATTKALIETAPKK